MTQILMIEQKLTIKKHQNSLSERVLFTGWQFFRSKAVQITLTKRHYC